MTTLDDATTTVVRHAKTSSRAPAWFTPAVLILAPVAMSFLAWLVLVAMQQLERSQTASEALTGFFSAPPAPPVSGKGIALLLVWYFAIVMVSMVGFWWGGTHRSRPLTGSDPTNTAWFERRYFFLILAAGAVGSATRS